MNTFRIDTHKKSGRVILWMEMPYGFQPIISWDNVDGVKEFATMLLNYYEHRNEKNEEESKVKEISNNLLRQALGEEDNIGEELS